MILNYIQVIMMLLVTLSVGMIFIAAFPVGIALFVSFWLSMRFSRFYQGG